MNKLLPLSIALLLFSSCVEEQVSPLRGGDEPQNSFKALLKTKSAPLSKLDSLKILSNIQSDVDNLMLGCVIMKDSIYVLAIKKEDAVFLGVSDDVYTRYQEYVEDLNSSLLNR